MRRSTILLAAVAATALTGCGTFDTDVVATVAGAELTQDRLDALVEERGLAVNDGRLDGDLTRSIVTNFVVTELLKADLDALGLQVQEVDSADLTPGQVLDADLQLQLQSWLTLPSTTLVDDEVRAWYGRGHEETGVICASHILVATEDEALDVLAELDAGTPFADVAAARSTDTGSAQAGGALGCNAVDQFEVVYVREFVDAALAAEIGEPTDPVESQFGFHVIRLQPVDELEANTVVGLRVQTFDDRYDIDISPRVGTWDPAAIVAPLG